MASFYPLTTSAESYSDSRETFTSDSSNVKKIKGLHELFSSSGYEDIGILCFFLFLLTLLTFFKSKTCENFWVDSP